MANCTTCSSSKPCSCKKSTSCTTGCTTKVNSNCVIYDVSPSRSNLTCFLGVNNGASLTKILEILDKKLCIPISPCAKLRLGLGYESDISMVMVKMLDYICELDDVKVKTTVTDKSNGYLFDKVEEGACLKKVIVKDSNGVEKMKIELDFACIESKLACCGGNLTPISIHGGNTVCGNNFTILTALSNCTTPILWSNGLTGPTIQATAGTYYASCGGIQSNTITVANIGNCDCIPIWRDAVPLAIFCGQPLGYDVCKKYIKQTNQCNNDSQWVEYFGSESDGSGCPGCGVGNFVATRSQTFVRNNCAVGCTPGSVTFIKTYTSSVDQLTANTLASNDNNFVTDGQNFANATGTCSGVNCSAPFYNASRTQSFLRNNCPSGCTGSSVSYTKTYTSYVSQIDVQSMADNDTTFPTEGQINANNTGTCIGTNCGTGSCTPTSFYTCLTNGNSTTFTNSCGVATDVITFSSLTYTCTGTNTASLFADVIGNDISHTVEYAITKIGTTVVNSPVYSTSSTLSATDDETFEVTCRITKGGSTCSSVRTVIVPTCTVCVDPTPAITITSTGTDICGTNSVTLSVAAQTACNVIEWYIDPLVGADQQIGLGNSIVVSPTATTIYKATCRNCNPGGADSNTITITHLGDCAQCEQIGNILITG